MQNKALKPCHKLSPINTYVVAEKEWDTKEDKRVHDVCVVVAAVGKKGKSRVEAMPNSEVIKPVALKYSWLEASVSQLAVKLSFHSGRLFS